MNMVVAIIKKRPVHFHFGAVTPKLSAEKMAKDTLRPDMIFKMAANMAGIRHMIFL